MQITPEIIEQVIAKCAEDHNVSASDITIYEIKLETRYNPNWQPFEVNAPDRTKEPDKWFSYWKSFNFEGCATHQVDMFYKINQPTHRALYGVNVFTGMIECWMS